MQKRNSLFRSVFLLLLLATIPAIGLAQDDLKPVTSKYAIKNATIVQAPGKTINNGTILIENGIIKAVGSNVAIPSDAWVVNADSMFVYAGFISGLSNLGVDKPEDKKWKDDRKLTGTPTYERAGITPGTSVRSMLNPEEKSLKDFRQLGFTASHSVPYDGMIAGTGSIVLLGGATGEEMIVKENVSMFSQLDGADGVYPNTVIGVMAKYRDLYRKSTQAKDYAARYAASPSGMERPETDATIEAMYPVVSKQMNVAFKTEGIKDIMRAIALQKDLGFRMMLGEVKQGWDAIPSVQSIGSPVFLSLDLPEWKEEEKKEKEEKEEQSSPEKIEEDALKARQMDIIKKYYSQAGMYSNSGVKFGFSTMDLKSKDFKSNLLKVIENGLSEDKALAALTTEPANILGVSNVMGTIDVGKMANLVVTDTSYFSKDSNVRFVFVDGEKFEYEVKKKKKKKDSGEATVDAAGTWNYTTETPQGTGSGVITIKGSPGDYTGTISVSYNGSTNDIEDFYMDGNKISFSFKMNMGEVITVDITMEIDGDTFEGTLSVAQFGSFPLEGSRSPN